MNEILVQRLYFHNPWWKTGKVSPELALPYKRKLYRKLENLLDSKRITVIKGPRRTGKSTIIYQIINKLLKEQTNPKNILYLSFEDIDLQIRLPDILRVWELEAEKTLEKKPQLYLFLDEVQFLDYWETDVKLLFDKKYPITFVVSGSSATLVRKTTESLAGRTREHILLPLDFEEYTQLEGINLKLTSEKEIAAYTKELRLLWKKYLEQGGFPHLRDLPEEQRLPALSEDIIEKVIYRDLVQLYNVKEPEVLEKMFRLVSGTSSGILNLSSIASNLKISWETAQNYLTYLKQAYLVFALPKYSLSPKVTARSLDKVYVIDPLLIRLFSTPDPSIVWESTIARYFWQKHKRDTYFWRDRYEVDIVINKQADLLPIEVKSISKVGVSDLKGLVKFCQKYNLNKGLVLYSGLKRTENVGGVKIEFIPAWEYLLTPSASLNQGQPER